MWLPSLLCIRTGTNCQLGESQSQDFQVQNVTAEPIMHTNRNKLPTWGIPIPGFFTWKIPIKPNVAALYIVLNHQDFSGISEFILEISANCSWKIQLYLSFIPQMILASFILDLTLLSSGHRLIFSSGALSTLEKLGKITFCIFYSLSLTKRKIVFFL